MPLTLVLGPANSAKAGEIFGAYGASAQRGALLVVPNASDAEHYSRELADHGAVLGAVLTFAALAEEIARRAGYAAGNVPGDERARGRRLTALQRDQLVARAVRSAKLQPLAGVAGTSGFARAAGELIAELGRSLVSPQRFAQAMKRWGSEDPRRLPYARDVAAIYLEYGRELERLGRVDSDLEAWRALDALRENPARWGRDAVFFYGFDDLQPLQRDAVETLARVVGVDVMVSLTYEAGRSALQARAEVVEELRPLAQRVVELPAVDDYYEPSSRTVLHHLERHLFETGSEERIEPGEAVRLLESAGERAEAELVAAEVLALLGAGIAAEEIAVVYRSPVAAAPVLARTFQEYGIPIALDLTVPFGHTALGRGLVALARCALLGGGEASAQDLLDYLRTPGLLERPELADGLELRIRRQGLSTAEEARELLTLSLDEIDSLRRSPDPAAELARRGRRLLAAPHRAQGALLGPEEELDARALAALLRAGDELAELGAPPGGGELIELLERLEVRAPARAPSGGVTLTDPLSVRARRFRAVLVCGLQEGEFPRTVSPEPFLSDEHRRELAVSSGLRLPQRGDALQRERYLFYSVISRATERIVLSYRSSDEEGNLELPSPFVADVAELLVCEWPHRRRTRLLADVVWRPEEAPSARELARARAAVEAANAPASAGQRFEPSRALSAGALAHVRHTQLVSAGALEIYADCPVKWLVERELNPKRLEPEPEPLARGSYMHDALEQVLSRLGGAVTPASLPEALEILDQVLAERPPETAPGRPAPLRRAAAAAIAADLRRYLEHEAATGCGWQPFGLELAFGFGDEKEESLPPLQLGEDAEAVAVRGVIDRVDVDPTGRLAVVRDYKSGSARPEHQGTRWSPERRLQVALYMLAVRDLLGIEPVGGLYQPLGGRDLRARGLFVDDEPVGGALVSSDARDREGLRAELADASARAVALAARLRAGDVAPCPDTCSREGCRYPGICRST